MNYLVTYDILDDKRRKKLSDILECYGFRVNYSVFEITLNQTKLNRLKKQIFDLDLIDKKTDSIRFYHICQNCLPKSFELSDKLQIFESKELFI